MKKKAVPVQNDIDIEAVLLELGQFGRYQKFVYTYLTVAVIFTAVYNCQYVFNAGIVAYRCRVPECESSPPQFKPSDWGNFALPSDSRCHQMVPIGKDCAPSSFSNVSRRCNSWVYENNLTIVPEFNLACREWMRTLVGTIHNVGVFAALPITAAISDAFGRRYALIGTSILPSFFGVARGFCNNYVVYLVLEFLEALVGAGTYSTAFILALELVDLKKRVLGGNIISCMYAVGQMVAAVAAWAMPYWRTYTIIIFAPSVLFVFYYLFVEESIRWLLCKGKKKEAARIILKIAATNKKKLLPATLRSLSDTPPQKLTIHTQRERPFQGKVLEEEKPKVPLFRQVLKSRIILFRLCVCSFWWVSVTMIYYGLSINSVSLVGGKYLNFIMTSVVEIPACLVTVVTLERFGRKASIMTSYFICGAALLVLPLVKHPILMVMLTLIGKMMISGIFCAIYIYTIELFPTEARHMLMGICSMTGRIGSMLAPQTPLLMLYMPYLPYLVFGGMAGTAGLLMLLTPETLHIKLPDTIAQAEQMNVATRTRKKTNILY